MREEIRNELAARAARTGRSLPELMRGEIARLAARPAIADLLADVRARKRRRGRRLDPATILAERDADRR